jgi:hypothetical protein
VNDNDDQSQGQRGVDVQPEIVGGKPDSVPRFTSRVKVFPVPADELGQPVPPQRQTILTLRMKKENADAFTANKLSEEEFLQAAEATTYLGPSVQNDGTLNYFRSAR